ncbi:MAG: prephenate dehydratase [Clostridia bacterium]|nr:prephenate dehydratase [Clostridia bacterium]
MYASDIPDISKSREAIDRIDTQLVHLFEERMRVSHDVALYKQAHHLDILNPERERVVLKSRTALLEDHTYDQSVVELFETLMALSRKEQFRFLDSRLKSRNVAYMGVPGAFSESAAVGFFGENCERTSCRTFEEVFNTVASDQAHYGIVPVENSSSGSINDVYDLLGEYACHIVGEYLLPVEQNLLALPGSTLEDITTVFSHDQGFAQCPDFLGQHPDWVRTPYFNTAIAAKHVSETGNPAFAAIASRLAAKHYGLNVLVPNIQSSNINHTRFIVVSASRNPIGVPDKATLTFTLRHERGTLQRALSSFVALDYNLTHIESRPIKNKNWEYRFYVDLTGNINEAGLSVLLTSLNADCENCRLLGAYKSASEAHP